jgi:hypothetical protein
MNDNPTDLLPEAAAEKLERLIALRDQRADAAHLAVDALRAKEADLQDASRSLHSLQMRNAGHPEVTTSGLSTTSRYTPPDPDAEARAKERITRVQAEVDQRRHLLARRKAEYGPLRDLVAAIERFLADTPGAIVDAAVPVLDLDGETPEAAVARIRSHIREIERERAAVLSAPVNAFVAKERARRHVDALVRAGAPKVAALLTPSGEGFAWPKAALRPQPVSRPAVNSLGDRFVADGGSAAPPDLIDAAALTAWIDPDRLLQRLYAEIDASAPAGSLGDDEREARAAALAEARLDLERQEERLVDGTVIERRPDASPLAVLGVEIVTEPAELGVAA